MDRYPTEVLSEEVDNGTMPGNVQTLAGAVVGRRIVAAEKVDHVDDDKSYWRIGPALILTLDDGTKVRVFDTSDCCAYTALRDFFLDPSAVDHVIIGVGTTDEYDTWHIYADFGDIMRLSVHWSPGNAFYYGYGFDIDVVPLAA